MGSFDDYDRLLGTVAVDGIAGNNTFVISDKMAGLQNATPKDVATSDTLTVTGAAADDTFLIQKYSQASSTTLDSAGGSKDKVDLSFGVSSNMNVVAASGTQIAVYDVNLLDGIVVDRRLTQGDLVPADRSVVLRLAKIDPLNVEVIAPSEAYGAARIGMSGTVSLQPLLPGTFKATVVTVDKLIDAASGTFGIRLQMPNPGNKIPAGLKCSVRLIK